MFRSPPCGRSRRRGAAAIEFGFWLPITMFMLSGIVDFGWYMAQSEIVMRAARDGARTGAATFEDPADLLGTAIEPAASQGANEVLTALGAVGCSVTPDTNTNVDGLDWVSVSVTCPFQPLIGMAPGLSNNITYVFTMFVELQ